MNMTEQQPEELTEQQQLRLVTERTKTVSQTERERMADVADAHAIDPAQLITADGAIRNFDIVTPWLYRGGQPGKEGIEALGRLGVKTVVCLRWGGKVVSAEKTAVEAAGMRFINIPLNYWNVPTAKIIDEFFALLDEPANRPLFIHCLHGADRTGLMVAMYRITHQNWDFDRAYADMKIHGFHRFRIRNFKWVLWRYAARHFGDAPWWWFKQAL